MTTEAEPPEGEARSADGQAHAGQAATVIANLPNGMFRLRLTDDREVVAHAAKDLRMALTRLLPGDVVVVSVSPFDPNKARICRLGRPSTSQHPKPSHPSNKRESS